jgi:hypothetical protein
MVERDEGIEQRSDHRGPSHPAANVIGGADLSSVVFHDLDADIMELHRRAISVRRNHRDLELARQEAEFGVEAGPLAEQLCIRARIYQLVSSGAGILVRADVADAIAAGLDGVHFHLGEIGQQVWRLFQLDPVVLDVLAGGEMSITAVIFVSDIAQHTHLCSIQSAIGDRDAQHIGVELEVEPVHQPQRLELILRQMAFDPAADLIAEFLDAGIDHRLVKLVIFIHQITQFPASGSAGLRVRSGRTVGPSARTRSLMWPGRTPVSSRTASIA